MAKGRTESRRSELAAVLALAALSAALTAGPFLLGSHLHHDTRDAYAYFFDNLDSLNRFGEPAWWSPQIDYGYPMYFSALIGIGNAGKPAFVLMGLLAWSLGRLGVELPFVMPLYVLYFGVLIPCLFLLGVWLVARQLLRSATALRYVLIVAAFSPGIVTNLGDPGFLEYTAYTLYAAAAYLHFVARPGARSFAVLALAAGLVSLAVGYHAFVTVFPWLPLIVVATAALSPTTRSALRQVRLGQWAAAAALLVATASPSLVAYAQQRDALTHRYLGDLQYSYGALKRGNPLEFLLVSVPALTFEWDRYDPPEGAPPAEYRVQGLEAGRHGGFNYLGLLALPLAALGLVYGRRRVRGPLFFLWTAALTVFVLSAWSPFFSLLLAFPSPLRSMSHYGDLLYRSGGFLLVLFAAGLGLEAVERQPAAFRRLAPCLALAGLGAMALWLWLERPAQALVGLAAALLGGFLVLLIQAGRTTPRRRSHLLATGLLALTLVDVSTAAFWHVRWLMLGPAEDYDRGLGERLGSAHAGVPMVLALRETKRLRETGLALHRLPPITVFCHAHAQGELPTPTDLARAVDAEPAQRSLALPQELRQERALRAFFEGPRRPGCSFRFRNDGDYNSRRLSLVTAQPSLLFLREAWSPHWRATLDGEPVPVHRAFGAFKAVAVPAGTHELRLDFSPPFVGAALAGAYAILLAGLVALAWTGRAP